ncbi:Elastase 2 [Vibrio orientalis CIP 102891 = ATCC 33934]|uniref:Elastase 2 n=1 Tax=Vibrio orientalis CIP 102891 = ATCC 33934 TaxID=675816 RepID=C9QH96_VIBOR|nr:trypsin-like serine protease [Vibrio orientalis]EEX93644.1 secreted trypsin-like serine protease [Vibrio orientalis CIP 102891 = ATCC 33934]EGU51183.1 Elastase 2 [Vibrio orientalis CIP 102891 = ATCC 33934]
MRSISVLASSLLAFSAHSAEVTPYIVNGTDISASSYPDFVSLFYDRINYDGLYGKGPYCGGTLLDEQHVLTAAHCIYGDSNYQLFTSVVPQLQNESDFPNSVQQRVMVNEYYYPSTYNDSTLYDDIAIVKLASPITAVNTYVALADDSERGTYRQTSEDFYAVGHGNTESNYDSTKELQRTKLKWVDNTTCDANYTTDASENLCMDGAATVTYDNATCQGDSGGPLYWNGKQVGITSFGPQTCGNPAVTANSVFTEVALTKHKDWINSVLSGNEAPIVTVTDAQRNTALGITTPTDSGGGGGSLGIFVLSALGLLGWRRRLNSSNFK